MSKSIQLLLSFFLMIQTIGFSQTWQGKKCVVVLTYDDALNVHLDNAIPILDSLSFKGSFYLSGAFEGCRNRLKDWRNAATKGHELGNHTLFHPCDGSKSGRSWLTAERDMSKYSVQRMTDEIKATNILLEAIDGKTKRTFAYTCGDMSINGNNFMDSLRKDFIAARAVRPEMHPLSEVDLYNVDCYAINGETGEFMIDLVKKAMESGKLLVFLFHGVGGEHGLNVDLEAHRELLYFLKNNEKEVWIAPMIEVAEYINQQRNNTPSRTAERDSILARLQRKTKADHKEMLNLLNITALRGGPSGNPQAPNAANRDENKVNSYMLPDPLVLKNGKKVKNAKIWWDKRRPEIVEDFEREIYGRLPKDIPNISWQVVAVKDTVIGNLPIREKTLKGVVDNKTYPSVKVEIELILGTPLNAKNPVPVVMEFGFLRSPFGNNAPTAPISLVASGEPTWKEQLIARDWGYAIIVPSSIQADNGAGLTEGIIGLVNKGAFRKADDWGALRAWAWGASRALDYFETDKDVDAKRIAIEGLSRYGKAAIVAMAFDSRFSLGFIGSSGAGGAKLLKRVFGEQVENLASSGEYHWFCGNFIKYAGPLKPDDMPVDAHELVALCAPRPVFISSGSPHVEGQWVDAKGMFLGGVHAGSVYRLLGKKDLGTMEFPKLGTPLVDGEIAFRQHAGGHSTGPNWSTWIAWACRYWGTCKYF